MKEINILEAIQMPQLMIDMVTPVKDYEKYDFHVGMKCKIDGFPFELMSENGKLSLEAGAIMLTARRRREQAVLIQCQLDKLSDGEKVILTDDENYDTTAIQKELIEDGEKSTWQIAAASASSLFVVGVFTLLLFSKKEVC